jgi:hypothetical protein
MTALPTPAPVVPDVLSLQLQVRDAEVVAALLAQPEAGRPDYALSALRIGVLAKQQASGQVDVGAVRDAGEQLVRDMTSALSEHGGRVTSEVATALQRYFDPSSGVLPQRLASLVQPNGELARVLSAHLGAEDSLLARTLARHLGETSPVFKLLSPTDASGVRAQVERTLTQAMEQQRARLLEHFSLDSPDSALSRLVRELGDRNGELTTALTERVDQVVGEFSLDSPDSALSRLVRQVEQTQQALSREFTLDHETSALSRMRRELLETLKQQTSDLAAFKSEMRTAIEVLQARKADARATTRGGLDFEAALGLVLAEEARRGNDKFSAVGTTTGVIRSCKVGDFVVQLGDEHRAAGTRIVWEAKAATATVKEALEELDVARRNREARFGVFVFEKGHAPAGFGAFERHGDDLLLSWDAEDEASVLVLQVAYSALKALAVQHAARAESEADVEKEIGGVINTLSKQLELLEQIQASATTAQRSMEKVLKSADAMRKAIEASVESLQEAAQALG